MQKFQQILNDADAQEKTKMGELEIEIQKLKSMIGIDYTVNWTELKLYIDISVIHEFLIEKLEKKD